VDPEKNFLVLFIQFPGVVIACMKDLMAYVVFSINLQ
jgi:hypothetical protein